LNYQSCRQLINAKAEKATCKPTRPDIGDMAGKKPASAADANNEESCIRSGNFIRPDAGNPTLPNPLQLAAGLFEKGFRDSWALLKDIGSIELHAFISVGNCLETRAEPFQFLTSSLRGPDELIRLSNNARKVLSWLESQNTPEARHVTAVMAAIGGTESISRAIEEQNDFLTDSFPEIKWFLTGLSPGRTCIGPIELSASAAENHDKESFSKDKSLLHDLNIGHSRLLQFRSVLTNAISTLATCSNNAQSQTDDNILSKTYVCNIQTEPDTCEIPIANTKNTIRLACLIADMCEINLVLPSVGFKINHKDIDNIVNYATTVLSN
jgi:hypothetical protein